MTIDSSATIHPSAIIEEGAVIGAGCAIGPYCVIGADVRLGARVKLHSHVSIAGHTTIGEETEIWPFAALGHVPQDLKYQGEKVELIIGARNRIREHATMHPGTGQGGGVTTVGDDGLFMIGTHVAHDCHIGNHVIMSNSASLAGHVIVEDRVILAGFAVVHQFVRLGRGSMIGGFSAIVGDVIPYGTAAGERAHLAGLNLVGLKRAGVERASIHGLRAAYDQMFEGEGTLQDRIGRLSAEQRENPLVADILTFMEAETNRHYTLPASP